MILVPLDFHQEIHILFVETGRNILNNLKITNLVQGFPF